MASLAPIRVAPGRAYFETTNNEPFLFIGPNDAITWPGLEGLYRRKDLEAVETYLDDMAQNGVTVLRLMLEYAHRDHRYFEYPTPGVFNPAMVRLWDDLFSRCEQVSIRVLLAPWDNFWMARRWKKHPYNRVNGGPCNAPQDFFTTEAALAATMRRFDFVIERWGGSGVIAAWDLFNEIHPHWGGTPDQQSAVIARLSEHIRRREMALWGWTRPQTVSIFGPKPDDGYEAMIWAHPSLDFATTHIYEGAIDFPTEPVTPAITMGRWVRYARERMATFSPHTPLRPFTDSEHGPIHLFNDHRKYQKEPDDDCYEQALMWAHLASGGAGSGMRWPARNPHLLTAGMRNSLRSLAGFARLVDWRHFAPRPEPTNGVGNIRLSSDHVAVPVHLFSCRDDQQIIAYLLPSDASTASRKPSTLVMGDVPPQSRWQAQWWDIEQNAAAHCVDVSAGVEGTLNLAVPDTTTGGLGDWAVVLRRDTA